MRTAVTMMVAAAALCAAAIPAAAQETPEQVVERYYDTFRSGDYAANAAMMDPAALEELKSTVAQLVETVGDEGSDELRATFGVGSAAELRALAPEALYERMLRSTLGDEEMREILQQAEIRVLGHVPEGEVAHVVYRMRVSFGGVEVDQVQIAPVRRTPEGWRVMLTGSLAGMMQGLGGRQ